MQKEKRLVFIVLLLGLCGCVGINHKGQNVQTRGGNFLSAKDVTCEQAFTNYVSVVEGTILSDTYTTLETSEIIYHVYEVEIDVDYKANLENDTISLYIPYAYNLYLENSYVPCADMNILDIEEMDEETCFTILYVDDTALHVDESYVFACGDVKEEGYVVNKPTDIYQVVDDNWLQWDMGVDEVHSDYRDWQEAMLADETINEFTWDMIDPAFFGREEDHNKLETCL